jgi:hypothetical protein
MGTSPNSSSSNSAAGERLLTPVLIGHILLVFCVLIVVFHPLLSGRRIPGDQDNLYFFYAQRALIHDGEAVFWNPYQFSGFPAYRDPQMSLFYPPSWLYRFFSLRGTFVVMIFGHYLVGAVGFLWLGLVLRLPRPARLLGALSFGLGGYLLGRFLNHSLLVTAAYAPWIFGCFLRAVEGRKFRWIALTAVSQALQVLAGMPHNAAFMMMALAAFALFLAVTERRIYPLAVGGAVIVMAVGLSAIQWIPTYAAIQQGVRQTQTYEEACQCALSLNWIPEFLLGGTDRTAEGINEFLEVTCYPGIGMFFLVPFALWHSRWRLAVFLLGMVLAAVVLALGPATFFHRLFFQLPGGKFFNIPGRFLYLAAWGFPLLAALGASRLLERKVDDRWVNRLVLLFFGGVLFLLVGYLVRDWGVLWATLVRPREVTGEEFMFANLAIFGSLSLGVLLAYRLRRLSAGAFSVLFVMLLAVDLLHFSPRLKREYISADALAPTEIVEELKRLTTEKDPYRMFGYVGNFSRLVSDREPISRALVLPKLANLYRLQDIQGWSPLHTFRYNQTMLSGVGWIRGAGTLRWILVRNPRAPVLDLLGVRYIIGEPYDELVFGETRVLQGIESHTVPIPKWEGTAREIQLVSCLDYSWDLPQGARAGEIVIRNASGERRVLPLRAGIETADFRLGFPGSPAAHSPGRIHRIQRHFVQGHMETSQVYICRIPFEEISQPTQIEIKHARPKGRLVIFEVSLTRSENGEFERVLEAGGIRLYRNPGAFPRAWWVDSKRVVPPGEPAVRALVSGAFDPGSTVLLEKDDADAALSQGSFSPFPREKWTEPIAARVTDWQPGLLDIEIDAPGNGLVVAGEMDDLGWRAELDGKSVPKLRANAIMMAVAVPEGHHTIRFRFVPWDAYLGFGVALFTAAVALAFPVGPRVVRKRHPMVIKEEAVAYDRQRR